MKELNLLDRSANLTCKLLDEDIVEIRKCHQKGETMAHIAHRFNVSPTTIWYWCLSEAKRQKFVKRHKQPYRPNKSYRRSRRVIEKLVPKFLALHKKEWSKFVKKER